MQQVPEQDKNQQPVPGFPTQTLDEIRADLRKEFPNLTDEELDFYGLSPSQDIPLTLHLGPPSQQTPPH